MNVPVLCGARNHCPVFRWRGEHFARLVGNAQAAAQIDMGNGMARRAQIGDQTAQFGKGGLERLEIAQLAADMHCHTAQIEAAKLRQFGIDLACAD